MDYPKEWDELPKRERKQKIKEMRRGQAEKRAKLFKVLKIGGVVAVIVAAVTAYYFFNQKTPEEAAFEQEVEEVSLEERVEDFEIEGRGHVAPGTKVVYQTNPPTSGDHYASPANWGVYESALTDEAVVHSLEHGGIWISYTDISDEERSVLEEIWEENSQSVIVSPRVANEARVVVASWGKMMVLEEVDRAVIQKYINRYKNNSPEKLAR